MIAVKAKVRFYNYILITLVLLVVGSIAVVIPAANELKLIRFLAPLLAVFILKYKRRITHSYQVLEKKLFSKLFTLYIFVILITILYNVWVSDIGFTYRNFVNCIFVLAPFITAVSIVQLFDEKYLKRILYYLFYAILLAYLVWAFLVGVSLNSIKETLLSNFIGSSESITENVDGLVFCMFVVLFLYYRDWKNVLLAFIFTILGAKRVAIGGSLIGILVFYGHNYLFTRRVRLSGNMTNAIAFVCTLLTFVLTNFWLFIYSGKYDDLVSDFTGLSTDAFLMGRSQIAYAFFNAEKDVNPLIGLGLGYVENILIYKANFPTLLHNDFLRLYMEFGVVPFLIWMFVLFKYSLQSALSFSILIVLLIIMQTDNVVVYDVVMTPFYLILIVGVRHFLVEKQEVLDMRKS